MVHVAKEMERTGMKIPLMIGGATTSRVHTAVKIAPHYSGLVVHVNDASRSVPVLGSLLSNDHKEQFMKGIVDDYARIRTQHENANNQNKFIALEEAQKNKVKIDWATQTVVPPAKLGVQALENYPLDKLVPYIDWTPFFHSWEMKGSYPKILDDKEKGIEAKKLFDDAQAMLNKIVNEKWLQANAVIGLFPANAVGDDIEVYTNEQRSEMLTKFHTLRQQTLKPAGHPNIALSDYVAPKSSGVNDYVGAFALTTGEGIDSRVEEFEKNHDDYSAIMLKALADRLAEAFAEHLHERVRKEYWGYAIEETFSNLELIQEKYNGIRPAPGYPAQPDHTEKNQLFELLKATNATGITLTESLAMLPTASVCGLYIGNENAQYFGLGKINREQVEDYAKRKGMEVEVVAKWLAPVLN
jgi:5-methyltetrahydrofolate--homocysteine methyltransferase